MLLTEKYVLYFIVKQSKAINILQISKMCWNAKSTQIIVDVVVVNVILLLSSTSLSLSLLKLFITIVILGMMMMVILQIPASKSFKLLFFLTPPFPTLFSWQYLFVLVCFLFFQLLQHCYPPISKTIISFLTLTHHINSKSPK